MSIQHGSEAVSEKIPELMHPSIRVYDPESDVASKFDFYIKIVIGVLIVAVVTMFFMVGGLLLDAFHFNSATYREYSEKINSDDLTQKNNLILQQQNQQNQELIIKQQEQILELLKK